MEARQIGYLLGLLSLGKNTYELCSTEKFKERPNEEALLVLRG